MRQKFTVYGLRFSKTTFWNRINTGFLEAAVATVLTACGIETIIISCYRDELTSSLQQYLPLAVLKLGWDKYFDDAYCVATVLTACGIET